MWIDLAPFVRKDCSKLTFAWHFPHVCVSSCWSQSKQGNTIVSHLLIFPLREHRTLHLYMYHTLYFTHYIHYMLYIILRFTVLFGISWSSLMVHYLSSLSVSKRRWLTSKSTFKHNLTINISINIKINININTKINIKKWPFTAKRLGDHLLKEHYLLSFWTWNSFVPFT